ncbi:MAG: prepilin-type N-terminal cleavage/methylation domain-containing protein [Myxococcota bacterium]
MMRRRRESRGITMMEVMVTMAIVAIGILGLTSMNIQSAQAVQNAAEISLATNLATASLDEIQVGDFLAMTVGPMNGYPVYYDKFGGAIPPTSDRFFTVNATVENVSADLLWKDVLVSVTWNDSSSTATPREVQIRGRVRQLARANP